MDLDRKELIKRAWQLGHLSYKLRPHQRPVYDAIWKAIDNKETSYTVLCSRQFGKSFIDMLIAFEFCIRNPGVRVPFAIPVSTNYRSMYLKSIDTILADIPKIVQDKDGIEQEIPDPAFAPVVSHHSKTIIFPNKSWIQICGVEKDNYVNLRGAAASLIFVDEAAFMTNLKNVIDDVLFPMTLTTDGLIVNTTTPPESLDHYFMTVYEEDSTNGRVSKFTIHDNSSVTPTQYKRTIRKYTNPRYPDGVSNPVYRREYLCEFFRDKDLTIIPEWEEKYVTAHVPDQYTNYWHRYVGMDMGAKRDFTVVLFAHYNFKERCLYIEDEFQLNGADVTTLKLADAIKAAEKRLWGDTRPYRRIADSNNPQMLIDMATSYQLPFIAVRKDKLDTRETILKGMVNKVRIMAGEGRIKVAPHCTQAIGCLTHGMWDKDKNQFARSDTFGHLDALAALVYLVKMLDEYTNPVPGLHGYVPSQHGMSPQAFQESQQNKNQWGKLFGKR